MSKINKKDFYNFIDVFTIIAQKNCSNREDLEPVLQKISTNFLKKSIRCFEKIRSSQSNLEPSILSFEEFEKEDFEDYCLSSASHYIIRPVIDLIEKKFIKISISNKGVISKESFINLRSHINKNEACFYNLEGYQDEFKLECLTDFFTPKEDFDYFLKTGRRFCDSKENEQGFILSEASGDTHHVYNNDFQLFVESVNNIISYFDVHNLFTAKGLRDWEIDFAIDCLVENRKAYLLTKRHVYDDGYCLIRNPSMYCNVFLKKENYEGLFFFKKQIEQIPEIYFDRHFTYKEVLERWSLSQERIDKILSELTDPDDIWTRMSLDGRVNFPRHKTFRRPHDKKHWYGKRLTEDDYKIIRLNFIKSAVFPERYLRAVESHYGLPKSGAKYNISKDRDFVKYLKNEIKNHSNEKPLPKESKKGNSYSDIAQKQYGIPLRRFRELWEEVTNSLPENNIWKRAGRPKK